MSSTFTIPAPLRSFYSLFPLHTWPSIPPQSSRPITKPTLWILPPRNIDSDVVKTSEQLLLSSDVECLKWQAFLALRGFEDIAVRWDVSPEGGLDGRLPNLHVPRGKREENANGGDGGELLAAHMIPGWVDKMAGAEDEALEGYIDEAAKDESHAWVSLLEGKVHAALVNQLSIYSLDLSLIFTCPIMRRSYPNHNHLFSDPSSKIPQPPTAVPSLPC
jgi:metaxin